MIYLNSKLIHLSFSETDCSIIGENSKQLGEDTIWTSSSFLQNKCQNVQQKGMCLSLLLMHVTSQALPSF